MSNGCVCGSAVVIMLLRVLQPSAESVLLSPPEAELELWLTFDASALSNTATAAYPGSSVPPASPQFVLDRSGNNRTASVNGSVTFGKTDTGSMSVIRMGGQGSLSVPGLGGFSWRDGFTMTVFFKRTGGDRFQSLVGNGPSPYSSVELRLAPDDLVADTLLCLISIEVRPCS
jgi:hypothetical protein